MAVGLNSDMFADHLTTWPILSQCPLVLEPYPQVIAIVAANVVLLQVFPHSEAFAPTAQLAITQPVSIY